MVVREAQALEQLDPSHNKRHSRTVLSRQYILHKDAPGLTARRAYFSADLRSGVAESLSSTLGSVFLLSNEDLLDCGICSGRIPSLDIFGVMNLPTKSLADTERPKNENSLKNRGSPRRDGLRV